EELEVGVDQAPGGLVALEGAAAHAHDEGTVARDERRAERAVEALGAVSEALRADDRAARDATCLGDEIVEVDALLDVGGEDAVVDRVVEGAAAVEAIRAVAARLAVHHHDVEAGHVAEVAE